VHGYLTLRQTREVIFFQPTHYIPEALVQLLEVAIVIPASQSENKDTIRELDYIRMELRHTPGNKPERRGIVPPIVHDIGDSPRERRWFRRNVFVRLIDNKH
jgi:hypothetical protein